MALVDRWLVARLACPYDRASVDLGRESLRCSHCGRDFPVVEGIPVMLRDDVRQTHDAASASLAQVRPTGSPALPDAASDGRGGAATTSPPPPIVPADGGREGQSPVDPYVQEAVGATCGLMYVPLAGHLSTYPIPTLRLPVGPGDGRTFLDVGCNRGRWSLAAARAGYVPIGIDPTLGAVRAATRVARQLGLRAYFVTGDARYLPLGDRTVDVAFSYSVLQHLAKHDVRRALREMRRVLVRDGRAVVQMPNARGLRALVVQSRRRFRSPVRFEVRYWTVGELTATFGRLVGATTVGVDGYFSLNPQTADLALLPFRYRLLVQLSEFLRRRAEQRPWLVGVADSLYVSARVD
jgi:SAM-dependent methyltransferase/uncharacterized protein YbaR (Trm112 family)